MSLLGEAPQRYRKAVKAVNLEFANGVEDHLMKHLKGLQLEYLNLNACQRYDLP